MREFLQKIRDGIGGRSFIFALLCLVAGFALAWRGRLEPNFVALVVAVNSLVTYRAKEADKINGGGNGHAAPKE